MAAYPALHLNPTGQPFNPMGALVAGHNIQSQQTQDALRRQQLEEAQRREEVRRRFADAGGFGNPGNLTLLNEFPDLYTQALGTMNTQQQMHALLNARAAQRVLAIRDPAARSAAWREELDRALAERRVPQHLYNQYRAIQSPDDHILNNLIEQATPLTGGLNPRQIMGLFGFGPGGDDVRTPPTGTERRDLFGDVAAGRYGDSGITLVPGGGDDLGPNAGLFSGQGGLTPPGPDTAAPPPPVTRPPPPGPDNLPDRAFEWLRNTAAVRGTRETPYQTREEAQRAWRLSRTGREVYYVEGGRVQRFTPDAEDVRTPPAPPSMLGPRWDLNDILEGRSIADPAFTRPPPPTGGPGSAGALGGNLLGASGIIQAALDRTRTQTTPPPETAGYGRIESPYDRMLAEGATGTAGPPPPTTTGGAAGTTGGLAGLRGAVSGMNREQRLAAMLYMLKGEYGEVAKMILGQTEGTTAVDRAYAPDFASWTAGGGYADVQRQLAQLAGVERNLRSGANLTGGVTGSLPDFVNRFINPAAISNRQRVEEVVQRSLRQILGAQFTEQEATRLIARAYDPTLPQPENLRRVQLLLQQIAAGAEARQSAANYFRQYGTLRGWQGRMPTIADFNALFDPTTNTAPPDTTGAGTGTTGELPTLTAEQAASLAPGTMFRGTDGNTYRVPPR